jgi:uncharacterized membrane protein required for colicin V production
MEILSRINWVDILVLILMIRMSYVAFSHGLSHEIFPFFGIIIVAIFTFHYYVKLGAALSQATNMLPEIANFLTFLALLVVLGILVKLIKGVLDKIIKVEWHPVIEKFGGILVGVMRAYIVTSLVLTILALMPLSYLQWSIRERSLTGRYVLMAGPEIYSRVSAFLPTVKLGAPSADKEAMMKDLISDKSVAPKNPTRKPSS